MDKIVCPYCGHDTISDMEYDEYLPGLFSYVLVHSCNTCHEKFGLIVLEETYHEMQDDWDEDTF